MQGLKLRSSIPGGALVRRANPQEQSEVQAVLGPHRRGGSPDGRTFGRGCAQSQQTPENNHIRWCWNKVIKGEAWCQMCVVIYHNP